MDLPIDTWVQILLKLKYEPIKSALNHKIINKSSNMAFRWIILRKSDIEVYSKRTFIQSYRCMICEKYCDDTRCISYICDTHPRRILLYCDKFECLLKTLQCYFKDMNDEKKYPFVKFSNQCIWIPRTNGGFSCGKVLSCFGIKLNKADEPCIDVIMASEISEEISNPPTNESFELLKNVRLNDILKLNPQFLANMIDEKLFTKCFIAYNQLFLTCTENSNDTILYT